MADANEYCMYEYGDITTQMLRGQMQTAFCHVRSFAGKIMSSSSFIGVAPSMTGHDELRVGLVDVAPDNPGTAMSSKTN
jgi:hypothetical protein